MKATNIVVSTVAALSMAGVLGIAYAQSTYSDPQTGTTNQGTMNQQDATGTNPQGSSADPKGTNTMPQGSTSMDSSTNMDSTNTTRSQQPMYNERVARADRN